MGRVSDRTRSTQSARLIDQVARVYIMRRGRMVARSQNTNRVSRIFPFFLLLFYVCIYLFINLFFILGGDNFKAKYNPTDIQIYADVTLYENC